MTQPLSEWLAGVKGRVAEAQETRTELRDARDSDCFDFPLSAIEARRLEAEFGDALDNLTESAEADLARAAEEIEKWHGLYQDALDGMCEYQKEMESLREALRLTPEKVLDVIEQYEGYNMRQTFADEGADRTPYYNDTRAALLAAGFVEEAVTKGDE